MKQKKLLSLLLAAALVFSLAAPAAAEETYEEPAQQQEEQYQEEGAAGIGQARALYDYDAAQEGDLSFREGDVITLIDTSDPSGWWVGELNGVQGTFPSNFVEMC